MVPHVAGSASHFEWRDALAAFLSRPFRYLAHCGVKYINASFFQERTRLFWVWLHPRVGVRQPQCGGGLGAAAGDGEQLRHGADEMRGCGMRGCVLRRAAME